MNQVGASASGTVLRKSARIHGRITFAAERAVVGAASQFAGAVARLSQVLMESYSGCLIKTRGQSIVAFFPVSLWQTAPCGN